MSCTVANVEETGDSFCQAQEASKKATTKSSIFEDINMTRIGEMMSALMNDEERRKQSSEHLKVIT